MGLYIFFILLSQLFVTYLNAWPGFISLGPKPEFLLALEDNNIEKLTALIAQGHSINELYEGETPLRIMIHDDNEPMVQFLLEHGAPIDDSLFVAVLWKRDSISKLLLKYGADPVTALSFAGDDSIRMLLDYGLNVSKKIGAIVPNFRSSSSPGYSKFATLFSHSWISLQGDPLYAQSQDRLKTIFLMHNQSGTFFSALPMEIIMLICSYLPDFFIAMKNCFPQEFYKNASTHAEIERRISQVRKVLRQRGVSRVKKKLRHELKHTNQNIILAMQAIKPVIGYLNPNKVRQNWLQSIRTQVDQEWETARTNKKRKRDQQRCNE